MHSHSFTALLTADELAVKSCYAVMSVQPMCTGVMIMAVAGSRSVAEVIVRPQEAGQVATGASRRGRPGTAVPATRKRDKS